MFEEYSLLGLRIIFGLILCLVSIFILGFIMRHLVRPIHDKIWKFERKKKKGWRDLFSEGAFLWILLGWTPLVLALALGGAYIFISSLINVELWGILAGLFIALFFGSKLYFMFEHQSHAERRWKKKKRR